MALGIPESHLPVGGYMEFDRKYSREEIFKIVKSARELQLLRKAADSPISLEKAIAIVMNLLKKKEE